MNKPKSTQIEINTTSYLSLPAQIDNRVVDGRDWRHLKQLVNGLTRSNRTWETVFNGSLAVFLSFLTPAIASVYSYATNENYQLSGLDIVYCTVGIFAFAVSSTSFFVKGSEKDRSESSKSDIVDLISAIEMSSDSSATPAMASVSPTNATLQSNDRYPDDEALFQQALEIAKDHGSISTSLIQRRLRIGYARAARIIDEMEKKGIVGEINGARPREVFLDNKDI
jgi:hypothetical protein